MVFETSGSAYDFNQIIGVSVAAISGELVDRMRVIDTLLDLRNAAPAVALVSIVDGLLRNVPGQTTVRSSWWQSALDELSLAASMELSQAAV